MAVSHSRGSRLASRIYRSWRSSTISRLYVHRGFPSASKFSPSVYRKLRVSNMVVVMPRTEPLLLAVDDDVVAGRSSPAIILRGLLVEPDAVVYLAPLAVGFHRKPRSMDTPKPPSCAASVQFRDRANSLEKFRRARDGEQFGNAVGFRPIKAQRHNF